MTNIIDSTVWALKNLKQSEFIEFEKTFMTSFPLVFPNKSKVLNKNALKNIFSIENELNLILISHLYLERMLNEILTKNLKGFEILEKKGIINSFYKKIVFLKAEDITPTIILNNLLIFNQIRNKYAHELNYNIANFDVFKFSFLNKHSSSFQIKRMSNKRTLNRILVRQSIFYLIMELTSYHRYLNLVNED